MERFSGSGYVTTKTGSHWQWGNIRQVNFFAVIIQIKPVEVLLIVCQQKDGQTSGFNQRENFTSGGFKDPLKVGCFREGKAEPVQGAKLSHPSLCF